MALGNAAPFEYRPQSISPPGETLKETLEELGIPQADLARRTGLSTKHINQIVIGKAAISPETALLFEHATGVPAATWNALETNWRTHLVRQGEHDALAEQVDWLDRFPLAELVGRNVLPDRRKTVANLRMLLDFFGVASPAVAEDLWTGYGVAFRRSTSAPPDPYATYAWLRLGVLEARSRNCRPYQRETLLDLLPHIRALTTQDPSQWITELPEMCAEAGVAVVFSPAFKKTHLSGATRWLTPEKVMIAITDRYKKDDRFWFTVFHELAHVLLHGKRLTFLDEDPIGSIDTDEREANTFAARALIPPEYDRTYKELGQHPKPVEIRRFANRIGISPGVVVGRLQYDGALGWNQGNTLKRGFDLTELPDRPKSSSLSAGNAVCYGSVVGALCKISPRSWMAA